MSHTSELAALREELGRQSAELACTRGLSMSGLTKLAEERAVEIVRLKSELNAAIARAESERRLNWFAIAVVAFVLALGAVYTYILRHP